MKKCFIYCRKSSEDRKRQVQSIEDQKYTMHQFALNHSLMVERIFVDEKSAGKQGQREGFNKLLKALRKGRISTILTWKIDRLTRNPEESGIIQGMLQRGQIEKIITSDRTYHPEDNALLFSLEGAMANQYLRDLSKNVKRGMNSKVKKGIYPGSAPYGYINVSHPRGHRTIEPDPLLFERIKKLWGMLINEQFQLADLFRIMKTKYPIRGRNEQIISFSTFHRIFNNQFYCGLFKWNGRYHSGIHTPMLTKTQFDRVQEFLTNKPKNRLITNQFHYRGIFRCGECNSCITAECKRKFVKSKGLTKEYHYYKCPHHKVRHKCSEPPMSKHQINNVLLNELEQLNLSDELLEFGQKHILNQKFEENLIDKRIKAVDDKLRQVTKKINTVSDNIALETDNELRFLMKNRLSDFQVQRHELLQNKESIQNNNSELKERIVNTIQVLLKAKSIIKNGLFEDKKRLLSNLGQDWKIKNRKIFYNPNIFIRALKQQMFEPNQSAHSPPSEDYEQIKIRWLGISELVRKYYVEEQGL